jgi:predicted nucleic acid-binding protein
MSEKERLLSDLIRRRDSAERLVAELTEARRISEQILNETNGRDKFKEVTGNSSIENAIESARKMAETLARQIEQFKVIARPEDLEPGS